VSVQKAAFATGVPPDIYAFHRYTRNSAFLSRTQALQYPSAVPQLSRGISHETYKAAYAPFTPSNSEQRLPPLYYRGCWHRVSRGFLHRYRQHSDVLGRVHSSRSTGVYNPKTFILHAALLRQAFAHCENSPLLPPVGVWAVSQSSVAVRPLRPATDRRLGGPLPRQLANRTRAHLQAPGLAVPGFDPEARSPRILCGISTSFPMLSPTRRKVTHALLTRSLLSWGLPPSRSTCMC
jgi:hypothetical protein